MGNPSLMKRRRFGRTGLEMPVLTCGGMRFQYRWTDVEPSEVPPEQQANLEAVVHRAFELGINHFETARGYGSSEMQLGWVLPKIAPGKDSSSRPRSRRPPIPREFFSNFDKSIGLPAARSRRTVRAPRHQQPRTARSDAAPGGCLETPAGSSVTAAAASSASPPTPPPMMIRCDRDRRVRLCEPPLVFRERLELARRARLPPGVTWACSSSARTTRAANSTSRRRN